MNPAPKPPAVRIFLVGLSDAFARSLARYFSGDSRLALTGAVPSLALAGALALVAEADLVLVEWAALGTVPRDLPRAHRADRGTLRIVVVADEAEPYRAAATAAGADAVISLNQFAAEIVLPLHNFFPDRFGSSGGHDA